MAKSNKVNRQRMPDIDQEELAAHICGITIDDNNDNYEEEIDTELISKFDITLDQFRKIMDAIFPLMSLGVSPLTNTAMVGFSNDKGGVWLAKKEINSQFMAAMIVWLSEGEAENMKPGAGFKKDVTLDGIPEYELTIRKSVYLTLDFLKDEANRGKVISTGVVTEPTLDKNPVRWVAKCGDGYNDWVIYYHSKDKDVEYIKVNGLKVTFEETIRKLVPCSDEAYNCYRR